MKVEVVTFSKWVQISPSSPLVRIFRDPVAFVEVSQRRMESIRQQKMGCGI